MSRLAGETAAETIAAMTAAFRRLDPRIRGPVRFMTTPATTRAIKRGIGASGPVGSRCRGNVPERSRAGRRRHAEPDVDQTGRVPGRGRPLGALRRFGHALGHASGFGRVSGRRAGHRGGDLDRRDRRLQHSDGGLLRRGPDQCRSRHLPRGLQALPLRFPGRDLGRRKRLRLGDASATKHYAMDRVAVELACVMPEGKTACISDDGTNVGMFKFVADTAGDLSAGTLHAPFRRCCRPAGSRRCQRGRRRWLRPSPCPLPTWRCRARRLRGCG